jgi:hypothetical protein
VNNHLHQIFTFLLICGKALKDNTIQTAFMDRVIVTAPHVWTNIIHPLDHYRLMFHCHDGVCPNPMDAGGVALQLALPRRRVAHALLPSCSGKPSR